MARDRFDSAETIYATAHDAATDHRVRRDLAYGAAASALAVGRLASAEKWRHAAAVDAEQGGVASAPLREAADRAMIAALFREDPKRALAIVDSALRVTPLEKLAPMARPYPELAHAYSIAGRPDRAKEMLAGFDETRKTQRRWTDDQERMLIAGEIAVAEGKYPEAIRQLRLGDKPGCAMCMLPVIGRAYDLSANADSAIAVFTRFADRRYVGYVYEPGVTAEYAAGVIKRLGELYEARGDRQKAARYYAKFIELWKNADPELQPKVAEVRKRLARLSDTEAKR